jgi:flagellar motor component MotA
MTSKINEVRKKYAQEVTKSDETKAVVQKMKMAQNSKDWETYYKVEKEYIDSLYNISFKKKKKGIIDAETHRIEMDAINKIGRALKEIVEGSVIIIGAIDLANKNI